MNEQHRVRFLMFGAILIALLLLFINPPSEARQPGGGSASPANYSNARIVDGVSFLVPTLTGQLPAVLENSRLAVNQPTIAVTTISAANTTVTLTLPAAGATLFHYITSITAVRSCTTAIVGSALLAYTTTNLPGTLAFTAGNACAVGSTNFDIREEMSQPLKSSAANTATTIVAPAAGVAGSIRLTAYYYTAP
jgi:hypothetical protein